MTGVRPAMCTRDALLLEAQVPLSPVLQFAPGRAWSSPNIGASCWAQAISMALLLTTWLMTKTKQP